ncbi:MAG: putative hydrophobic protein (TIGR00271 family) [Saprospiraceae bacterium]|jgi:uncharacterized hydrophobic protein (TIGR00271 family)
MADKPTTAPEVKEKIKKSSGDLLSGLKEFIHDWLSLKDDLDREGTITNIQNNKRMRGANAWLLMCSIMVASLGLNLNSPAVIIGAMLISPLMSPILGIGLSIGINDRAGLWVAMQHFGMSIVIALITSVLYFCLTPIDEFTNEIAGRTEPGILDVLVAVFGGLAGIISGSRIDKSNAIPGVAIATALMPPLCVTGYGLANGNMEIAFNSFYLFMMNSTFIALTTYLLVTFMNFPKRKYETQKERGRTRRIVGFVAFVMLVPSIFIFSKVLTRTQEEQRIQTFLDENFPEDFHELKRAKGQDSINVKIFLFEDISDEKLDEYHTQLTALNCQAKYSIIDAQESGISKDELDKKTKSLQDDYLRRIEQEKRDLSTEKDREITQLLSRLDSLQQDTVIFKSARKELKVLYPLLNDIQYARMQTIQNDSTSKVIPTFLVKWDKRKSKNRRQRDEKRMMKFLLLRKGLDTLQIIQF